MSSRDKILSAVANNQPPKTVLPDIGFLGAESNYLVEDFVNTLTKIGGKVIRVTSTDEINSFINEKLDTNDRSIATVESLKDSAEYIASAMPIPHSLQNADHVFIETGCGVAENGAVWITESSLWNRVLPFICQHLYVILKAGDIVSTMHNAYEKIGLDNYGYGVFIAGPSKTADIEQSLVIGAHGPRSMTVFLMD
jgi:L-lactate dehydrogenase complex protein LldG